MSGSPPAGRDALLFKTNLRDILEATPDAIIVVDARGRVVFANSQTERMFAYPFEELIGLSIEALVPSRFHARHEQHRAGYFADPHKRNMGSGLELAGLRKDASEFPVEISLSPVKIDDAMYTMAAIRDVTIRKKIEAKFRGLLEAAPDAMVIVDRAGSITLVNSQTEKLFGYTRDELLGKPVEMLVPAGVLGPHAEHRASFFADPRARMMGTGLTLAGRRKDGSQFRVEISLSPVETEDGMLVTAAVRDISARIEVENALLAANRELEGFTYSVSHDLRAPIRQIDGFSRLLIEKYGPMLDEEGHHYLARIQQGAAHMGRLVDDLLNLARIGRQDVRLRRTSLTPIARQAAAELGADVAGRLVEWHVAELPTAELDSGLMKVVFVNLLGNALKYTRPREHAMIEVGQVEARGGPAVFVRDNGVGFDMQYADKLFGVFQRLHRVEDFEGTGVGLATVHSIVRKHGGEIWAESVPEQGTTFFFRLATMGDAEVAA
jgi:PAS domain S-box-containing protein